VEDGILGYADAGGAISEEVTEWAEGTALEEDVVDGVNEGDDMVWTDAGWVPALPSGAWDESAVEVLDWHEAGAEPPRKTTRKEWRGSAREVVPEHTTAPVTTRMKSTWVDTPPPPPPPPPPPRMDDAASSIAQKARPPKPAPPRGPPPPTMCPDFEEAQQLQQQQQEQQQYEQEQGQAWEQQEHEQNTYDSRWKRPRIRGGLKLRAKQALDAASRGDFHTAQRIAKGNSRRESLN
jgi:hypothetical protein